MSMFALGKNCDRGDPAHKRGERLIISSPPSKFLMAAVAIAVRGQSALTATPCSRNSPAMPSTHMLMPNFAIVYAT